MKSHFGASETLGLDSLALRQQWWRCYENYETNNIWMLKPNISNMLGRNRSSKRALMWFGEAQWVPTQIRERWKDQNSLWSDSEKYGETSHEYE